MHCREVELELREELDLQQARLRELTREKETALEMVCDRENTIAKFRSFVNQVPCLSSLCVSSVSGELQ